MSVTVAIIGILDDGWAGLNDAARQALQQADLVIGAGRTLALVSAQLHADCERRDLDGGLSQVVVSLKEARAAGRAVVVLATGDPLCHGIANYLIGQLGADAVTVLPTPSTLQLACARFKKPWQDVVIASCHGPDAGEWVMGAPPPHGLYAVIRAIAQHPRVAVLTSPRNDPGRLARALRLIGYDAEIKLSIACRLLSPDEAIFINLRCAEVAARTFPEPNVMLVERAPTSTPPRFGLEDHEYQQRAPEKGLITKQEARALSLAKLRLQPDAIVWDIGAGSGAVGLECARLAPQGHVWAIEKNQDDAANAWANAVRLRVSNYTLCVGKAPDLLATWPDPDAVFIGGSGGELAELIGRILARLQPGGRLVMNFVTLENLATAIAVLQAAGVHWDVTQLQASRSQPILDLHRLAAQNPVWIVTASREP
jgi:precorrin-6Y C5,15-methyltransferase (decarboxylating)